MTNLTATQKQAQVTAKLRAQLKLLTRTQTQKLRQQVVTLKAALCTLPSTNPGIVRQATRALLEAADNYRTSFPLVDKQVRRLRPRIADARTATSKLKRQLVAARETAQALPVDAIGALAEATDASRGAFVQDLERQILSVDTALAWLKKQPHKPKDHDRNTLALEVALVFRDILKLKPASTRDTDPKLKPGSLAAGYARVLRRTLAVAGWPQVDLGPVIDRGLVLLTDPRGDDNVDIPP